MPRALITGSRGQDGTYLRWLLSSMDYEIFCPREDRGRGPSLDWEGPEPAVVDATLSDRGSLTEVLKEIRPDEVYNLAGPSSKRTVSADPIASSDVIGFAPVRLLEAIRGSNLSLSCRLFQASSSEIFGKPLSSPQNETTPVAPNNPYGAAKAFAHQMVGIYRRDYRMYAVSGICYNHESPLRRPEFVTRHITRGVARIALGLRDRLMLGSLDATRDWGFAGDFACAMWLSLQQSEPQDYVISTGEVHSVGDFCDVAFAAVGISDWSRYVRIDSERRHSTDPTNLRGDNSRIKQIGWNQSLDFEQLVTMMVLADLRRESEVGHDAAVERVD